MLKKNGEILLICFFHISFCMVTELRANNFSGVGTFSHFKLPMFSPICQNFTEAIAFSLQNSLRMAVLSSYSSLVSSMGVFEN